ncbi:MAG TPA: HAMP domain-containing sensor histidine kinase [Saprospiraceae bacterium]|nr:HAMP domain-containing histidine kinase [Saprospiraceae bacterium]MCB9327981.1 HAMP domain-containing histidine kinase [Lewinellaceae bacterium]HPK08910.1 HAMP domain-containing sensor histidine kinase [Saprospiraceae bacterium]HPQ20259.1 HAMP domain-containing sensor histidine kinase [Saprospiraceae bacterium]HRX28042.1 HAMP domain-containing sensor histidine kinase [Saprospiraceae bacterium]
MPSYLIRRFVLFGALTIIGMIGIQTYWLRKSWELKDKEFDQTVQIILRKVAIKISAFNKTELPKTGLIQRRSSNFYAVNINGAIDASVLEDYLIREMENHSWTTDFEYAIYDCSSDDMVYGNYCAVDRDGKLKEHKSSLIPKIDNENFVYYFVVTFPSRDNYLISNMRSSLVFGGITTFAIIFFIYSIWVILHQKRLSELQSDFINNMTHEFKTPIASINLATDVLRKNPKIIEDEKMSKYLEIIKNQNKRLNSQVEKVLDIAKLEQHKLELKKEKLDLLQLLEGIVEAQNIKGQAVIRLNATGEDFIITADEHHLTNVIYNIIDNAIKYCKRDPEIDISINASRNEVDFSITDNGIGINKEDIKHLFDKFYRVHTGNIHDVKGFGLGLFYVKSIVDKHQWNIFVDSTENKGTTFTIKIPRKNGI